MLFSAGSRDFLAPFPWNVPKQHAGTRFLSRPSAQAGFLCCVPWLSDAREGIPANLGARMDSRTSGGPMDGSIGG